MPLKRRNFFNKLMKLVGGGKEVQSSKAYMARLRKDRRKRLQRPSLSSTRSHIEPMPTIIEEDESFFV